MSTKYPNGKHPNSIANLAPPFDSAGAKKAQLAAAKKRSANAEARNKLKMSMQEWKRYKVEVLDEVDMNSVDILKILMMRALDEGEIDTAADLAKSIAEFEMPKLARIESTVEEVKADELSDAELDAKLKELMNGEDDSGSSPEGSGEA